MKASPAIIEAPRSKLRGIFYRCSSKILLVIRSLSPEHHDTERSRGPGQTQRNALAMPVQKAIAFIALSFSFAAAYTNYQGTMNDFMGVNVHQQLWQYHYLGTNTTYDIHQAARWVRRDHSLRPPRS